MSSAQARSTFDESVTDRISRHGRATPNAVAVELRGVELTYAELEVRASRLASYLCSLGVGPEVPVGVCLDRSIELVVCLVAILKAGGCYLPLDPAYPPGRIGHVIGDTAAPLVLSSRDLRNRLPSNDSRIIYVEEEVECEADGFNSLPQTVPKATLAYVIYTSGSTGAPKGVCVMYGQLNGYLEQLTRGCGLTSADIVLHVTSISFDPSVRDLLGPLIVGARLVLIPQQWAKDPEHYREVIQRSGVTTLLSITPTLLRELSCDGAVSDARVTRILTCGEILDFETVRAATAAFGAHLQVFNQYGPTECTMTTTAFRADPARELRGPVPIGSPVPGAQVYVLDPEMNPVHAQVGEIYIGGAGVSRGYWRRAGLTAERFLPDPFADVAGARLYRTGDLGLLRTDGVVEFRGRADQQVKIGGVRIELGEIEAALLGIPGVGAAAVVAIEREQGEKLLTAFLVTQGVSLSEQLIRSNLSQWLPASMLPSRYVPMEEMPRTLTGKIDRLRLLETAQQEPVRPRIEPASRTEKLIASVWAKVLRVETFGVSDNLFVLGATSLDAARIANRLATALQVPVPVYAVFDAPTIAELAGVLDSLSGRARQGGDC